MSEMDTKGLCHVTRFGWAAEVVAAGASLARRAARTALTSWRLQALVLTLVCCTGGVARATQEMHDSGTGRLDPWTNCTTCHGSDLTGGFAPSCMSCHQDFSSPNLPPTGHHFPGRDDPYGSSCTTCHGADLTGDVGPSCYACHGELWGGGGGENTPPNVVSGGPYYGQPGVPLQFDASGTTDADDDVLIYLWSFGDGSQPAFPSQIPTITHKYEEAGTYNALLSVTDGVNLPVVVEVQVFISTETPNEPPVADAGGPYSGIAGQSVQFNASGSSDPDDDPLDYAWDFGDGSAIQTSQVPTISHTYATAGNYTVTVSVSDGIADPVEDQAAVSIVPPNTPPVANAGGPYSGQAGTAIQFDGGGSFDVDGDTLSYKWNFGDGTVTQFGPSATTSHTYAAQGTYTVTLTVSDGVNNPVSATTTATVSASTEPPLPPGDNWEIRLPLLGAEGTVHFEHFAGFLFVDASFSCRSTFGIGMRAGDFIFWMDSAGALFAGMDGGDRMMGLVFNFNPGSNSIWFAEAMSEGTQNNPVGQLGGLLNFF